MANAVKSSVGSSKGSVAMTSPKAGMKAGAKQSGANKMFKNAKAPAKKSVGVVHGKSGMPSAPTAKGKSTFMAEKQQTAFTNPTGVMKGAGCTRFVN